MSDGRIGYLAARSHTLVPVTGDCPVASPKLNEALAVLREKVRDPQFPRFVKSIELFTNETDVQVNIVESDKRVGRWFFDQWFPEWPNSIEAIDYETGVGSFRVGPRSFFQTNRFLIEKLVESRPWRCFRRLGARFILRGGVVRGTARQTLRRSNGSRGEFRSRSRSGV